MIKENKILLLGGGGGRYVLWSLSIAIPCIMQAPPGTKNAQKVIKGSIIKSIAPNLHTFNAIFFFFCI